MQRSARRRHHAVFGPVWRLFDLATNSLTKKIIWLTCLSVFLSTLLISVMNYVRLQDTLLSTATEKLAGQTRLMAQRFKNSYDQMESDAQVLSYTPPIQGIIRSRANAGVDPLDGSSTEIWRERLSTIFSSVMRARPDYLQIRYIGVADNGRELVRVNRTAFGIYVVAEAELQEKASEPYFRSALDTGTAKIQFSDVTFNREQGALDSALVPTVRAVLPVYDKSNSLYGMIVINAEYGRMLSAAFEEIAPLHDTIVFNSAGDYIEYGRDGTIGELEFHDAYSKPPPPFLEQLLSTDRQEAAFTSSDTISYFVRLVIDPGNPDAFLGVVLQVPYEELLGAALRTRTISIITGLFLVLACLFLSLVLARRFTQPLRRMTDEIKNVGSRTHLPDLPLDRNDEFGDLARAFHKKTRELADSEEKIRSVFDNSVDGILTINEAGLIDSYNPACEAIFGHTAEEAIGQNVKILMPEPYSSEHDKYVGRYVRTGERHILGETLEVSARRKDGSVFPIEISVSELRSNNQRLFSSVVRDISERKQIEILKDEFISTVNHEIRTPLTAIQGSLGLLRHKLADQLDEKGEKLLNMSYENCENLAFLINDILDIEKMAAGKMEYQIEDADLCALVAHTVERQDAYAEKYGVKFVVRMDVEAVHVQIDQSRFNQALVNLLSNAAKFSPEGGSVEVTVSMRNEDEVAVSVKDYGPGIPESFHEKIFEKFAQVDSSATRAKGGTGLGLAITKTIIEELNGSIEFKTEVGKGTTFTILLPVGVDPASARASEIEAVE